jgi:hypothetical protein
MRITAISMQQFPHAAERLATPVRWRNWSTAAISLLAQEDFQAALSRLLVAREFVTWFFDALP